MFMAQLRGKLSREQENMEDILTSNVFGAFKYLPPEKALLPFLSKAMTPKGDNPLASLPSNGLKVGYTFWPWLSESDCKGCEPDVLIRMSWPDGKKMVVLIEAKYHSGKSSSEDEEEGSDTVRTVEKGKPPIDQLAREWDNLKRIAERDRVDPVLIYLTAHFGFPSEEIQASQKALTNIGYPEANIFWLTWRHLPSLIEKQESDMLKDLADVLRRLNLTFFEGKFPVVAAEPIRWRFNAEPLAINWSFSCQNIRWRFVR